MLIARVCLSDVTDRLTREATDQWVVTSGLLTCRSRNHLRWATDRKQSQQNREILERSGSLSGKSTGYFSPIFCDLSGMRQSDRKVYVAVPGSIGLERSIGWKLGEHLRYGPSFRQQWVNSANWLKSLLWWHKSRHCPVQLVQYKHENFFEFVSSKINQFIMLIMFRCFLQSSFAVEHHDYALS